MICCAPDPVSAMGFSIRTLRPASSTCTACLTWYSLTLVLLDRSSHTWHWQSPRGPPRAARSASRPCCQLGRKGALTHLCMCMAHETCSSNASRPLEKYRPVRPSCTSPKEREGSAAVSQNRPGSHTHMSGHGDFATADELEVSASLAEELTATLRMGDDMVDRL